MGNTVSSRPEDGSPLLVWDVPTLWELARDLPIQMVDVEPLGELDRVAWYGPKEHSGRLTVRQVADHVRRIQKAGLEQPILLSAEGHLMDGFHRLAKAYLEGVTQLPAKRFPRNPEPIRSVEIEDYILQTYFPPDG